MVVWNSSFHTTVPSGVTSRIVARGCRCELDRGFPVGDVVIFQQCLIGRELPEDFLGQADAFLVEELVPLLHELALLLEGEELAAGGGALSHCPHR